MEAKTTEIFYLVDEFCKEFHKAKEGHIISKSTVKKTRNRKFILSDSEVITIMVLFLQFCCLGKCTCASFIDFIPLRVCHIRREHSHKVFKGMATKGQCSIGWFFGFKLHIVIID